MSSYKSLNGLFDMLSSSFLVICVKQCLRDTIPFFIDHSSDTAPGNGMMSGYKVSSRKCPEGKSTEVVFDPE
jgi:hypothetical protein